MPTGVPGGSSVGLSQQQLQEQQMVKLVRSPPTIPLKQDNTNNGQMQTAMESCIGKSIMSGAAGFALGGAFGLFMSSVCPSLLAQPISDEI